jgi:outer membrane protein OmpA-like peptidoglycan-associated protein
MRKISLIAAIAFVAAAPLAAQRAHTVEAGIFGQYSTFDSFTKIGSAPGFGGLLGVFPLPRWAFEYQADLSSLKSDRVGNLTMQDNRFDIVYNHPLSDEWKLLVGGGWTGTRYQSDTTKNQYDSGGNALLGLRYCVNSDWSWRGSASADFKDPSDQTPGGQRTTTYGVRVGVSRLFGGNNKTSPCYVAPPPPPPPPAPRPAPAPAPPPPPPAPAPVQAAPAPPPPPPAPAPAKAREIFKLEGVLFDFNKSTLTKAATNALGAAVTYLKANPNARIEVRAHTDSKGTDAYNQALSDRRATTVVNYLKAQGIDAGRMSAKGFGESEPVADNGTDEGRALNRRAVIIELP